MDGIKAVFLEMQAPSACLFDSFAKRVDLAIAQGSGVVEMLAACSPLGATEPGLPQALGRRRFALLLNHA